MDRDAYARVREMFLAAEALPAHERSAYVEAACGGDIELRSEVESLLGHTSDDAFIEDRSNDPLGLVGTVIHGRYRVDAYVDEGGFAYVYRAQHEFWNKPVAIKMFKAPLEGVNEPEAVREAFVTEGALLNDLSRRTTSIVQSYDVGLWDNPQGGAHLFTVLEWLEGQTLQTLLERERKGAAVRDNRDNRDNRDDAGARGWRLERVIATLGPIAEALAVAHAAHIAHRDVKPSNIFVMNAGDGIDGTAKLLDFGIAKVSNEASGFRSTAKGSSAFSLAYAAPEQSGCTADATGPWSDVYGLAMVCSDLLCGQHPIGKGDIAQLIAASVDPQHRPTPGRSGVAVSPAVESVLTKALHVATKDRYPNVESFWEALVTAGDSRSKPVAHRSNFSDSSHEPHEPHTPHEPHEPRADAPPKAPFWRRTGLLLPFAVVIGAAGFWAVRQVGGGAGDNRDEPTAAGVAALALEASERKTEIDPGRLGSFSALPAAEAPSDAAGAAQVELGRHLFWEPMLSSRSLEAPRACASCHDLANYGTNSRRADLGHASQGAARNTPSVYNHDGSFALMWDGSARTLEEQVLKHLSTPLPCAACRRDAPDPKAEPADLVARLRGVATYREAFARAFPNAGDAVTVENSAKALAAFMAQLATPGARWDQFLNGDTSALTDQERAGFNAFVDTGCVTCHFGPHVGNSMFQKLGLVRAYSNTRDRGRYEVTRQDADFLVFRVPSLRDVEKTGPYFHDGSVSSLAEAVRLMGHHQLGKNLSDTQVEDIVAWLGTLTGVIPTELASPPALGEPE